MIEVPVHYDFASTLCYVAHRVMERMQPELDELGIELCWTPLDLTRIAHWRRGDAFDGSRRDNTLRVASELGVQVRLPNGWMDSRPAMAVALALRGDAREAAWRERVWSAVYEQGCSLDDSGLLTRLGRDLELDAVGLADSRNLGALELETELAVEAGVSGVPAFVLGGWPLGGIHEEATMRSLLGRYAERRRAAGG